MNTKITGRLFAAAGLGLMLLAAPALRAHGDDKMGKEMLEHMKKDLALSDSQYSQVKAECATDKDACKVLGDKMTLDVDTLKVLVDKKASDDELKPAIATLIADHKAMQAQMAEHLGAIQALLTPTQQAKEAIKMCEMMKHEKDGHGKMDKHEKGEDKDGGKADDKDKK